MADQLELLRIFVSYARADGRDFAAHFYDELPRRSIKYAPWYDEEILPEESFHDALEAALCTSNLMLVVLTEQWQHREWCKREMLLAQLKRIPIVVAQMNRSATVPFGLIDKNPLPFYADDRNAWQKLEAALDRHARRLYEAKRTPQPDELPPDDARHVTVARERSARRQADRARTEDPESAERRLADRVEAEQRREQTPTATVQTSRSLQMINEMPDPPRTSFQDRVSEMREVDAALSDPDIRLVTLAGDGGSGKTALLAEFRRRLDNGRLAAPADSFVYLAARGYRQLTAEVLLTDLARAIRDPDASGEAARRLGEDLRWHEKVNAVLVELGTTPVIVAIDDLDDLLDEAGRIADRDLRQVIGELIGRVGHRVRVLATLTSPDRFRHSDFGDPVRRCGIPAGLPATRTRRFLNGLDRDGLLARDLSSDADIDRLSAVSQGRPRVLELVYCLLRTDPDLSLSAALDRISEPGADRPALLREILQRLDDTECMVVQGLAIYGRPVRPEAIDHLLRDYVPGVDSEPVLGMLAARRLVRRDGDRYFLPPRPDARRIRETVPAGRADDWYTGTAHYTRPFLHTRAADFYAGVARNRVTPVTGMDDLQPEFDEIQQRIAAGAYDRAVTAMEAIDEKYLTGWGQSGVLLPWRATVAQRIRPGRMRASNLSFLASARAGEEDHDGSLAAALSAAMRESWARHEPAERLRLTIQLADTWMDSGRVSAAAERYVKAASGCRRRRMTYEAAAAHTGHGLCLARLGRFAEADAEFADARKLADGLTGRAQAEIRATVALNAAWSAGQQGDDGCALDLLDEGTSVAEAMPDLLLQGRLLDSRAALLCDRGDADLALEPATRAADIGIRTGNTALSRDANVTLALAYLQSGNLTDAPAAARAAVQQTPGARALAAWAVMGVVRFRVGDIDGARSAFHTACTEGWLRLDRDTGEFAVHDALGIALTGLEVCGERHRLWRALEAFAAARAIAPAAGARRRAVAQLELFGRIVARETLRAARAAADGRTARVSSP